MAGFTTTEVIDGSPEDVFAYATDFANAPAWLKGIVKIEPITDGPLRVGSRWRETRLMGKREATAEIEIVEHAGPGDADQPPYRHAARAAAMGVEGTYFYTFAPEGTGQTRVELRAEVKPLGLMGRLMVPMVAAAMKKQDGDQLRHLKQAIEGGEAGGDGS